MVPITFLYGNVINSTLNEYTLDSVLAFFRASLSDFSDPTTKMSMLVSTGPVCDTICVLGKDMAHRYIVAPAESFDIQEFIDAKTADNVRIYA